MGINCISDVQLADLTDTSRFVAEVANMPPQTSQPFVGASAFAHKGGLHASAMAKNEHSYQHISPSAVGNSKRVLKPFTLFLPNQAQSVLSYVTPTAALSRTKSGKSFPKFEMK